MPKRRMLDLPEEISAAYPDNIRPKRIETNRLAHTSPFVEFPGEIITPLSMSAEDYHEWWTQAGDGQPDDDNRHWAFFEWETRFHLVKKWDLKTEAGNHLDSDVLDKNPIKLPDMRLISWMVAILQPVISNSVSLPNLPRPSNDTTTQK